MVNCLIWSADCLVSVPWQAEACISRKEVISILQSYALKGSFIKEHGLNSVLIHELWDVVAGKWVSDGESNIANNRNAYDKIDSEINSEIRSISEVRDRGLVTVSIERRNRDQVENWQVREVNEMMRTRTNSEAESNLVTQVEALH